MFIRIFKLIYIYKNPIFYPKKIKNQKNAQQTKILKINNKNKKNGIKETRKKSTFSFSKF
jgi:hypothetical protein